MFISDNIVFEQFLSCGLVEKLNRLDCKSFSKLVLRERRSEAVLADNRDRKSPEFID